ncbi:MAG: DUF1801 domain-containing protein [Candidatus Eisenbacteria bacterium]|uniref:DUF1801 domain-containing protein n=1 Tax=Eiseniibacteriota bacterium TaxID=2212470 RepID=A0A933SF21_UNCEI|nr:DUF1801 domain-containing protein [Candidatus Eisenbacteria bacterium]
MVSSKATSVAQYLKELPADRRAVLSAVRELVNAHLPKGFAEVMQYGMIAWIVPPARLPVTYNGQPYAVLALAAQKHNYALYSMGAYVQPGVREAFVKAYRDAGVKLDMGGSCIRFRTLEALLQPAVARLVASVTVEDAIAQHEARLGGNKKMPAKKKAAAAKKAPAKQKAVAKKKPAAKQKAAPAKKKPAARAR